VRKRRLEAAAAQPRVPESVVRRAALRVGEDLVCLGHLAEAPLRLGLARDIGMELAREGAKRALDLRARRASLHAEHLVVVAFGRGHGGGQASS
jgi:hypothetical protein